MTSRSRQLTRAIRFALVASFVSVGFSAAAQAQEAASAGGAAAGEASAASASQDGTKASAVDLDKVVVTGRSGTRQRSKAETSYSITAIEEERLRLQAPTSVTEAMKSVPGFWVEASGGEASGNIRARGIPVDGFGSVTLLEDGIPVQHDPALGYLNGDQAFRLDETVERVEVVRGGPSSVFYSNAPAGAINFIPRTVGDTAEGVAKLTVGDYGLTRYDLFFGTPLGGGWKLGLGGFWRSDDGLRDPGYPANDGGQYRINLSRAFERGRFSFDYKRVDDKVALYLGIPMRSYADGKIRGVPGFDAHDGTLAGPQTRRLGMIQGDGSRYDFDNSLGTQVKRDQYTAKFDYELGAGFQLAQSLRYSRTRTQRNGVFPLTLQSDARFYADSAVKKLIASVPGAVGAQLRYVDAPEQAFAPNQNGNGLMTISGLRGVTMPVDELISDTRLMRRFDFGGQSHDVTLGYYYARFDQDFDRYSSNVLTDVRDNARLLDLVAVDNAGLPLAKLTDRGVYRFGYEWENASGRSTTQALYLSDEWQVNDKLRIDAGVRWEQVKVEGWTEVRKQVNLGTPATSQILTGSGRFVSYDQKFDKIGWTVGANWQFDPHQGVFARWTPAFRLPSLSSYITKYSNCDLAKLAACANDPNGRPVTQTMDLGEIGYKFSNERFDLFATLFYTKYDNVGFSNYVFDLGSGASTVQQGYADTKTTGLELEGFWTPVRWFDLHLTATIQDPKYKGLRYTELVNGAPVLRDFVDNQLIRVPKNSFRAVPGLNLLDDKLRLQVSYEHEGERFVDTANSVKLPSYHVINASARYEFAPGLSLYLYADNLTNSLGLTEGNPRAGELQSADAGNNTFIARPLLGRGYRAALMYRF
ncbi:TonB-dependent receptor [Lysobacter enzymogenes]|uniref:Cyclic nucleotide-binding protein n=1 Tax=Lysobacter enzymogenes TaxID=69 RepID=A0A3N2RBJ9_LYSEN|nr:TonB-dependent receptor [Lysobacter enzymogenes]ROU04787.1 cyclic nucleotide-binding protein [Lysobacter enzymogenes]